MKKTLIVCLFAMAFVLCGCNKVHEIENNRIITACIAIKDASSVKYGFYVSVPTGSEGGEDSGSESTSKIYEYKADNFSHALSLFEDSGTEKTDISHISLFAANKDYYTDFFKKDEKYIREKISATPLVYTCIIDSNYAALSECINSEYGSKAEDFSKNIFASSSTRFNCMLSELSLGAYNSNYTAVIPVLKIQKRGDGLVPEIASAAFYTPDKDITVLSDDEYAVYGKWIKKYGTESKGYDLSVNSGNLVICSKEKNIAGLAQKYMKKGADILNAKYYAKKCFPTLEAYNEFIDKLNKSNNIVYEVKV